MQHLSNPRCSPSTSTIHSESNQNSLVLKQSVHLPQHRLESPFNRTNPAIYHQSPPLNNLPAFESRESFYRPNPPLASSSYDQREPSAYIGRNELALGYDSLLGHHPLSSNLASGSSTSQYHSPRSYEQADARFRTSSSPSGRDTGSGRSSDERRREGGYGEAAGLPDLPYSSRTTSSPSEQSYSNSSVTTMTPGDTYFPLNELDSSHGASRFVSTPIATPSSSSSSSASAALLMSPLSPHVAPFSPATPSGSSGSGGLPWSNAKAISTAERALPTSPLLDLRSYPLQAQQQQQQQQQQALYEQQQMQMQQHQQREEEQYAYERERNYDDQQTPLAQRTAQALPPHDNHQYPNIAALGLTGVPEYTSQTGDSMSSLSYLQQQQPLSSASSQFSTSGYTFEDVPSGSWSATMSTSDSREGLRRDPRSNGFGEAARSAGVAVSGAGSLTGGNDSSVEGNAEEICTIFVVGFPDDMQEREFQNMFVLSVGFEAATLKIPTNTKERELSKGGSVSGDRLGFQDPYGGMLGNDAGEDSDGQFSYPHPTPPLPFSNAASVLSTSRSATGSPAPSRKQIIGFAKFRTRAQALDARDLLSGKKVDAEKGSILKAEMAKKNLHTKRGISNEIAAGTPLASLDSLTLGRLASASTLNPAILAELSRQNAVAQQQLSNTMQGPAQGLQSAAAFDAFHSVPSHFPVSARREREPSGASSFPLSGAGPNRLRDRQPTNAEQSFENPASPVPSSAAYYSLPRQNENFPGSMASPPLQQQHFRAASRERTPSTDYAEEFGQQPSPNRNALAHGGWGGKSMMQQLDEGSEEMDRERQRMATNQQLYQQQQSQAQLQNQQHQQHLQQQQQPSQYAPDSYRQPSLQLSNQFSPNQYQNETYAEDRGVYNYQQQALLAPRAPASMAMGQSASANSIPRTLNPSDMNAPKNTLYVGGLPTVLPSLTGPFSAAHLEDSLRNAFSRCPGFRRLCFRSKSNGPIVFVEFDDVGFATRALQEMYGNQLGGIVKGGIRLSYSKNPLGVRAGSISNGTGSPGSLVSLPLNSTQSSDVFASSLYGNSTPTPNRRPSESVFGPGIDYRPAGVVGMGSRIPSDRFGSTFSPFGSGYDS